MLFRHLIWSLMLFFLYACHTIQMVDEVVSPQAFRKMIHYNDSCGNLCNRYVFSHVTCDSLHIFTQLGKQIPVIKNEYNKDSLCYSCSDFSSRAIMMEFFKYKEKDFSYFVSGSGELSLFGYGCSKKSVQVLDWFSDSISVCFWNKIDDNGTLTFYAAEESLHYPYYKPLKMDSFVYDLNNLCAQSEIDEEHKLWQEIFEKYIKVSITPNPFSESFEFKFSIDKLSRMLDYYEQILSFYDDQGNLLSSQIVKPQTPYTLSFPNIKSGKTIFYRITWSDYVISGQVLKS